jgi:hypothetical protein
VELFGARSPSLGRVFNYHIENTRMAGDFQASRGRVTDMDLSQSALMEFFGHIGGFPQYSSNTSSYVLE